jgi:hypothetical protein
MVRYKDMKRMFQHVTGSNNRRFNVEGSHGLSVSHCMRLGDGINLPAVQIVSIRRIARSKYWSSSEFEYSSYFAHCEYSEYAVVDKMAKPLLCFSSLVP